MRVAVSVPGRVAQAAGRARPGPEGARADVRGGVTLTWSSGGDLRRSWRATAADEPLQPQDLVITLLGDLRAPVRRQVWSGGLVVAARRVRVLARRGAGGVDAAGPPRPDRTGALRATRPLSDHAALRAAAAGGRRKDLLARFRACRRGAVDTRLASDSGGPAARAKPPRRGGSGSSDSGRPRTACGSSPHDHSEEVRRAARRARGGRIRRPLFGPAKMTPRGCRRSSRRAWNLSGLVERYEAFVDEFRAYLSDRGEGGLDGGRAMRSVGDQQAFVVRTRLVHLFREFPVLDPELPTALAPPWRVREGARWRSSTRSTRGSRRRPSGTSTTSPGRRRCGVEGAVFGGSGLIAPEVAFPANSWFSVNDLGGGAVLSITTPRFGEV